MGRTRKPTEHLELIGAFKKDPNRRRDPAPVSEDSIGEPPSVLNDEQRAAWDFLVDTAPPGLLTRMDAAYLSLCAMALAHVTNYDPAEHNGKPLSAAALANVSRMLTKLGMTPVDRHNVTIDKPQGTGRFAKYKTDNPFANLDD